MIKNSLIYEKACRFSIEVVEVYKTLLSQKEYIMSKQLLRAGTSIGANLAEANGAISSADFSSKVSIAYKECIETKYWLYILLQTKFIGKDQCDRLYKGADEIARMAFSIIKNTRLK